MKQPSEAMVGSIIHSLIDAAATETCSFNEYADHLDGILTSQHKPGELDKFISFMMSRLGAVSTIILSAEDLAVIMEIGRYCFVAGMRVGEANSMDEIMPLEDLIKQ